MAADRDLSSAIRTPDQRLRVFVSSTLAELAEERAVVARAISSLRLTPVLFELGARPHPPQELYRAYLRQSDIFVGLYWQRYGWVGPGMDISGLEDEFQLSQGMPRLLNIKTPAPDREDRLSMMIKLSGHRVTSAFARQWPVSIPVVKEVSLLRSSPPPFGRLHRLGVDLRSDVPLPPRRRRFAARSCNEHPRRTDSPLVAGLNLQNHARRHSGHFIHDRRESFGHPASSGRLRHFVGFLMTEL